jgi:cytochrome c-type biogenesis protein CcmH
MISFWVAAGVLAACAAGLVLYRAAAASRSDLSDPTSAVYRRQLAEIDDLSARGLLPEPERKSAYAEAGRRLLGADAAAAVPWSAGASAGARLLLAALGAAIAALLFYVAIGRPGFADQPFAQRLAAWRASDPASLDAPELAAVLRRLTRERPDDPEAFRFLALAEGASQEPAGAVRALRRAVELAPARADLWELLGQAEMAAAGDEVTDDAADAFREAAKRDPKAFASRFHLARRQISRGDRAAGVAAWRTLYADMSPDDPRRPALAQAIAEAEGAPKPAAAPSAGQQAMIQGMVDGLARRLAAQPDDPQGWVRLVRAYAVLGDAAKRDAALAQARNRYAGRAEILSQLDEAARAEPMR